MVLDTEQPGERRLTEGDVLLALLAHESGASVMSIGTATGFWKMPEAVAEVLGDLVARGLVAKSGVGIWSLTARGERFARRARGPFGPYG